MARAKTIVVSGKDGPGITAGALKILAHHGVQVLDVGQAVIADNLSLFFLVDDAPTSLLSDLVFWGKSHRLEVSWTSSTLRPGQRQHRSALVVTVLATPRHTTRGLAEVTALLAKHRLNISGIERIGRGPIECLEFTVSSAQRPSVLLRRELLSLAQQHGIDIAIQPEGVQRWAKRLVAFDMDSTLIQDEIIDLLAETARVGDQVSAITEAAMEGELNFRTSLRKRVKLLKGLDARSLPRTARSVRVTMGARELVRCLSALGCETALISGGFTFAAVPLARSLGITHVFANTLEIAQGRLTGRLVGPLVDAQGKARILRRLARNSHFPLSQVVAVGDGANDLPMLSAAGLGIAFNAKPKVRAQARVAINTRDLRSVLHLMGLSTENIRSLVRT